MPSVPLDKKHIPYWVEAVLDYGRCGDSIEIFFKYQNIRKTEWDAYSAKYKKIRMAMVDAEAFARGVAKDSIQQMMYAKNLNQTVAKLFLDNMTGWGGLEDRLGIDPPVVNIVLGKHSSVESIEVGGLDGKTNGGASSAVVSKDNGKPRKGDS